MEELVKYLKALIALQLRAGEGGTDVKVEVVLARSGLKVKEIAELVGKNEAAVAKTISRAKNLPAKENQDEL